MSRVGPKIEIRAIDFAGANRFVEAHHRHHKPVQGHRFSLCAVADGKIVGVAIVGRPVARLTDHSRVLEVTRLCTDGTPNACSALYGAAARAGAALGYERIQTFVLQEETGHSLKASGWVYEGLNDGRPWNHQTRQDRRTDQPQGKKGRWARTLAPRLDYKTQTDDAAGEIQSSLFDTEVP